MLEVLAGLLAWSLVGINMAVVSHVADPDFKEAIDGGVGPREFLAITLVWPIWCVQLVYYFVVDQAESQ